MKLTPWIFIGSILMIYGILIAITGVYYWMHPANLIDAKYHLDMWWGIIMLIVGGIFLRISRG